MTSSISLVSQYNIAEYYLVYYSLIYTVFKATSFLSTTIRVLYTNSNHDHKQFSYKETHNT